MILTTPTAAVPYPVYDVVARVGDRIRVKLAVGESLLGFGVRSVYTTLSDADGIPHVRRHPWPPGTP